MPLHISRGSQPIPAMISVREPNSVSVLISRCVLHLHEGPSFLELITGASPDKTGCECLF